jgi:hypothetical protein
MRSHGLYEQNLDGSLSFLRAAAPQEELSEVVQRVATRERRLIRQPAKEAEPIIQAPALKVFAADSRESAEPSLAAEHDGFNLHAALNGTGRFALRSP